MAVRPIFIKDPSAVLDYAVDWSAWLAPGEVIVGVPVVSVPIDLTLCGTPVVNGGQVVFWLSGGVVDQYYCIECLITTSNNPARIDRRVVQIRCQIR